MAETDYGLQVSTQSPSPTRRAGNAFDANATVFQYVKKHGPPKTVGTLVADKEEEDDRKKMENTDLYIPPFDASTPLTMTEVEEEEARGEVPFVGDVNDAMVMEMIKEVEVQMEPESMEVVVEETKKRPAEEPKKKKKLKKKEEEKEVKKKKKKEKEKEEDEDEEKMLFGDDEEPEERNGNNNKKVKEKEVAKLVDRKGKAVNGYFLSGIEVEDSGSSGEEEPEEEDDEKDEGQDTEDFLRNDLLESDEEEGRTLALHAQLRDVDLSAGQKYITMITDPQSRPLAELKSAIECAVLVSMEKRYADQTVTMPQGKHLVGFLMQLFRTAYVVLTEKPLSELGAIVKSLGVKKETWDEIGRGAERGDHIVDFFHNSMVNKIRAAVEERERTNPGKPCAMLPYYRLAMEAVKLRHVEWDIPTDWKGPDLRCYMTQQPIFLQEGRQDTKAFYVILTVRDGTEHHYIIKRDPRCPNLYLSAFLCVPRLLLWRHGVARLIEEWKDRKFGPKTDVPDSIFMNTFCGDRDWLIDIAVRFSTLRSLVYQSLRIK